MSKLWDLFVSHKADADGAAAMEFVRTLERHGVKCWIAPRDMQATMRLVTGPSMNASTAYDEVIPFAIENSCAFAVLLSSAALQSEHIKNEINLAKEARLMFFPVRLEDIALTGAFRYHLGRVQWSDCFAVGKADRFEDVANHISEFVLPNTPADRVDAGRAPPIASQTASGATSPVLQEVERGVVILTVGKNVTKGAPVEAIYQATRAAWVIGAKHVHALKIALSEADGEIIEVFEIDKWSPVPSIDSPGKLRWQFTGCVARDEVRNRYIGKRTIKKKGQANPVRIFI